MKLAPRMAVPLIAPPPQKVRVKMTAPKHRETFWAANRALRARRGWPAPMF